MDLKDLKIKLSLQVDNVKSSLASVKTSIDNVSKEFGSLGEMGKTAIDTVAKSSSSAVSDILTLSDASRTTANSIEQVSLASESIGATTLSATGMATGGLLGMGATGTGVLSGIGGASVSNFNTMKNSAKDGIGTTNSLFEEMAMNLKSCKIMLDNFNTQFDLSHAYQEIEILNSRLNTVFDQAMRYGDQGLDKEQAEAFSACDKIGSRITKLRKDIDGYNTKVRQNVALMERMTQSTNTTKTSIKGLSDSVTSTTSALGSGSSGLFGKLGTLSGAFKGFAAITAVMALKQFGQESIELASDLVEVQNVVDTAYGSMADIVNNFALECQESFGMSELSAKKFMGTLGSVLQSANIGLEDSYIMASNMTKRVADLSSFYNMGQEEAMTKMQSAIISGETEAIKSLGINMTVANLEAYRLAQGIQVSYSSMTQAQQTALRYNYVMQQSKVAMFDYKKTSDSYANSQRTLALRWDALKSKLGTFGLKVGRVLLPILEKCLDVVDRLVTKIGKMLGIDFSDIGQDMDASNVTDTLNDAFSGDNIDTTAIQDISDNLGSADDSSSGVKDNLKKATDSAKSLRSVLAGFDEFNTLNFGDDTGNLGDLAKAADYAGKINGANLNGLKSSAKEALVPITDAYNSTEDIKKSTNGIASAWGNVKLNAEDVKKVSDFIMKNEDSNKMTAFAIAEDKCKKTYATLQEIKNDLNTYNWKVNMGIDLTPQEAEDYKKKVDEYCETVQRYIKEQHEAVNIAFDVVFGENSAEGASADAFYAELEAKAKKLSAKAHDLMQKAFDKDGHLVDIDAKKEADNILAQLSEIEQHISEEEFDVQLNKLKIKASGADLDYESFQKVLKETKEEFQKQCDSYDEMLAKVKTTLDYQLESGEITQEQYDEEYRKAQQQIAEKKSNSQYKFLKFAMDAMVEILVKDENLNSAVKNIQSTLDDHFENLEANVKIEAWAGISVSIGDCVDDLKKQLVDANPEIQKQAKALLDSVGVDSATLEKQKAEWAKAGVAIPEGFDEQLRNVKILEALSGDSQAMLYLVGNQMKGTEYETAIKKAQQAGYAVPEQLLNGLNSKKVDLSKGASELLTTVSNGVTSNQSKTNETVRIVGAGAGSSLATGVNNAENREKARAAANKLTDSAKEGVKNSDLAGYVKKQASYAGTKMWYLNESKNLSNAKKYGKNLIENSKSGVNKGGLVSHLKSVVSSGIKGLVNVFKSSSNKKSVYNSAKSLANNANSGVSEAFKIKSARSQTYVEYGKFTVVGYNKGVTDYMSSTYRNGGCIDQWVSKTNSSFSSRMGIKSPSRVFKGFGYWTVKGFNVGIEKNADSTKKSMNRWLNNITDVDTSKLTPSLPTDFTTEVSKSVSYSMSSSTVGAINDFVTGLAENIASEFKQGTERDLNMNINLDGKVISNTVIKNINSTTKTQGFSPIIA